ncbi:hypothetical protein Tco_1262521 [Tanacetum coccineum]
MLILFKHPFLLNHHHLDLRRNSPRGNRGRTLQLPKRSHNKMTVFLHLPMIHLLVVLDLEKAKDAQAKEIADLKKRRKFDDADMFDIDDLHGDEVNVDMRVGDNQEQSVKERETRIQIKAAKPKVVTTAATTTTRPKARGVVVQEASEFRTPQEAQPSMIKDKGKGIMIEPEVPLKRKDQVALDEDLERNLQAQLEDEIIEEEKLARKQEEEANIALIESWDNTQAMMEADFEFSSEGYKQ